MLIYPFFRQVFLICICFSFYLQCGISLQENSQNYVCENFRIHIEDHPHAFNPSIIKWQERIWMCFRENIDPYQTNQTQIGMIELDKQFQPIGKPQILSQQIDALGLHDARLVSVGERLYLIYSAIPPSILPSIQALFQQTSGNNEVCRLYISELLYQGEHFLVINTACITEFDKENPERFEKNWVPFDFNGYLLLAYSLKPHKIFYPLAGHSSCVTLSNSEGDITWNHGELRGSTPGILDGEHYLSFFHSSMWLETEHSSNKPMLHYFMGAYRYSSSPPFNITHISPDPIIAKEFYEGEIYEPYWNSVRVVFPWGLIIDQDYLWLSYGKQDHEMWIAKVDKKKLLESLVEVKTY